MLYEPKTAIEHSVKLENQLPFIMTKIACFSLKHKLPNVLKAISFLLKNWANVVFSHCKNFKPSLKDCAPLPYCNYLLKEPTRLGIATHSSTALQETNFSEQQSAGIQLTWPRWIKRQIKGLSEPESGYWLGFRFEQRNHWNTGSEKLV